MRHSKYLFGIIRNNNEQMRLDNIKDKSLGKIYSISYQDISGVVRDYPGDRFDFGTREEVAQKLVSHQTVIEKVMEKFSIIPIKFGTVLRDEQEVKRILIKAYREFKESLENFSEKIELDVVVSWEDLNALIKKIGDENKEIRDLKEKISQKQKKEDVFQEKIKIGAMIKEVIDKKKDDLKKEIIEILSSKTKIENVKKHELMNDSMILNCGFLLHKEKEKEFNNALHELNDHYNDSLKFRCLGPLPLYSFLTYEIKMVD
ncbi:MAG TPA: GvpL/GvpF family gas vesicle protein, partial [Acidobacteriota bacterium]|nr:GvpL/GvpF family gas vesicle protein [Acidobacteriota bacterium]